MPDPDAEHPGDLLDADEPDEPPVPVTALHAYLLMRPSPLTPTYARRTVPSATDLARFLRRPTTHAHLNYGPEKAAQTGRVRCSAEHGSIRGVDEWPDFPPDDLAGRQEVEQVSGRRFGGESRESVEPDVDPAAYREVLGDSRDLTVPRPTSML
jgi:hypothetical protein